MNIAILAGGKGTRLRPITNKIPKALVPVSGVPFLKYILKRLKGNQVFLMVGYKGEMILDFCRQNKKEFKNIRILYEPVPLGTGGALGAFIATRTPLLVMNGDTYVDVPFKKLLEFHKGKNADVTVLSFEGNQNARGVITHDVFGRVSKFGEKSSSANGVFSTGVYVINPSAIRWLVNQMPLIFSMEKQGFPRLVKEKRVFTYVSSGDFFDIGTHEALEAFRRRDHV